MPEFRLPDVGEGLTEAEVVTWRVAVGDTVAVNDVVVEIETAKSLVELPSPYAGVVAALLVPEGETVPVGTPIIRVGEDAEAGSTGSTGSPGPAGSTTGSADDPADAADPPTPTLVGYGPREGAAVRRARRGSATPSAPAADAVQEQLQSVFEPGASRAFDGADEAAVPAASPAATTEPGAVRALAKPPVRKLARDLGVDLAALVPTGPSGTVTRADVEGAAGLETGPGGPPRPAGPGLSSPPARPMVEEGRQARLETRPAAGARETREPIRGVRKMMGQAMVASAFTVPHVTEWVEVDVTPTLELVDRLRTRPDLAGVRINPMLVLCRAALLALRRTPIVNSVWDDAAQEVVVRHYVNLGVAAATPRGLVVPNVKDAQDLSLVELAEALAALVATAKEGRTQPADTAGGTLTITNVGPFGIDGGTPIINPGEAAILCFGAIRKRPWVVDDAIVVRSVATVALSFDHRHIDGETGSRYLADVAGLLADPATALLY